MAKRYVDMPSLAEHLAREFWPGPFTMVLPRRADCAVSLLVSAGLNTLAVRAPNHPISQTLIRAANRPLAAPSANRSGAISPTTAAHVQASLGQAVDMIIDGGPCLIGVESTIVKVDDDALTLLRPGGLPRDEIERVAGTPLQTVHASDTPQAPGMLASHYAPCVPVRLNASAPENGEAFLGFGAAGNAGPYALNLSESGDLTEAAANLFKYLHSLDHTAATHNLKAIAVAPIPMEGLGEAINDRLHRAAAPRA